MTVGRSRAVALIGMRGAMVDIEVDFSASLPGIVIIGLPDTALGEARERVRSAAANSGCPLPPKRITVNLSPAALPKHGSAFDLGIALSALVAAGKVLAESVASVVHIGELGLDGRLRSVPGVLPAVLAARDAGADRIMVPADCADEAGLVGGVEIIAMQSLRAAAEFHGAVFDEPAPAIVAAPEPMIAASVNEHHIAAVGAAGDLADVVGNEEAVEALLVAAAGGHHLFMVGPPGAGKTMLASRLSGILPDLELDAAIEVACVRSLGALPVRGLPTRPPFESPHHTASAVALVGGGSGVIRPGAISRAAHGVLFLDEAPELSRVALDALRQPLESGVITVHRAGAIATFPANAQLVMAANPCPCGRQDDDALDCTCTPMARRRYLGRLSGPLLDRVDLQIRVRRVTAAQMLLADDSARRRSSAGAAARVAQARGAAIERLAGTGWRQNSQVSSGWLTGDEAGGRRLPRSATAPLDTAFDRGSLSMRGYHRLLRVGWSVADLAGATVPTAEHFGMALIFRSAMSA